MTMAPPEVVFVDTSAFMNILNVPAFNQKRAAAVAELRKIVDRSDITLLLPTASIIESGNHIAQLSDGGERRRYAEIFATQIKRALRDEAPWKVAPFPDASTIRQWMCNFPDHAMREIGMADLSIIQAWEDACKRHSRHRIRIWSYDHHLSCYDRQPG